MIRVTRLNGSVVHLNAELVSCVESHHDTVITLVDGKTCVVVEPAEVVVASVVDYRARVIARAEALIAEDASGGVEADLVLLRSPAHVLEG